MTIEAQKLGVCYYPEHWPETVWADDARKMVDLGLKQVRIGEFAWSRIEPDPGRLEWDWLDRSIETLGQAGLEVMLGTPTATPPKWLIDQHPDILAHDAQGRPRQFGSRRHYCFSSQVYRTEAARIVELVAERYGGHDAVTSWQTDNEYGCHDTVRSYSPAAKRAFRVWLNERYGSIADLNTAWGTVFWSQEYRDFDEVDLPNLTVTEPHPSHVLDFYRFSSDQVVAFNRMQTQIIRKHAPGCDIVHNYMGFYFNFDHFEVAKDLDGVGWDSYPLGFLDVENFSDDDKQKYMRRGHPDFAGFFHDLYRGCGRGRWQILEQQPGPVNWAPHNPAPETGMVRLWALEGFAHGAEVVNFFRWRQAPFAQEQMHAGLERPNHSPALGFDEARRASEDLANLVPETDPQQATIAIVFSYEACWLYEAQPQGAGWSYTGLAFDWYSALRAFGVNVDFISPAMSHDGYALVIVPSLPIVESAFLEQIKDGTRTYLFGPRSGSKTLSLQIPDGLAPGLLKDLLPLTVSHVESFPPFHREQGRFSGTSVEGRLWFEHVISELEPIAETPNGEGLLYETAQIVYAATVPGPAFLEQIMRHVLTKAELAANKLPDDVRIRQNGDLVYAFNYGDKAILLPEETTPNSEAFVIGGRRVPPAGVSVWRTY
ncbi:MAG: beta-galactosidase [Pseudomonadota bacterium]